MASMLDRLLAADISDPTDFPADNSTTQGLRQLDDALRCHICREFYDAPVTLTCGHCFCSACIRAALPAHALCPSCRKPASEVHIRKEVAMEAAVHAWKIARPHILRLSLEEEEHKAQPPQPVHNHSSEFERVGRKRRRRDSPVSGSDDEVVVVSPRSVPSGSSTPKILPDLVQCPVCAKDVPSQTINMHLDSSCKRYLSEASSSRTANASKNRQKERWSQLLAQGGSSSLTGKDKKSKGKTRATPEKDGELEHLPKVAYDIHPQKRIAAMLTEWDLPTHGDRAALIRRYERWIVLYNANVDRAPAHRHAVDQLRRELRITEEADGKTRKEIVDDPIAYQKANKTLFAKLTEAARPRKPLTQEKARVDASPHDEGSGDTDIVITEEDDH